MTPDARNMLVGLPGCSEFGKRVIYFDGHGHTNQIVEVDNGYLMGGHGIMGMLPENFSVPVAADYGFSYVHSTPTELHYCQEVFSDTLPAVYDEFDPETINVSKVRRAVFVCSPCGSVLARLLLCFDSSTMKSLHASPRRVSATACLSASTGHILVTRPLPLFLRRP